MHVLIHKHHWISAPEPNSFDFSLFFVCKRLTDDFDSRLDDLYNGIYSTNVADRWLKRLNHFFPISIGFCF